MPLIRPRSALPRPALPAAARVLLAGVGMDALGTGLVLPFLVVYLHDVRGIPLATVGLLAALPAVVALGLLAPLGVLIDRLGPRRVQIGALACASVGALALAHAHTVLGAGLAQLLVGVGQAAFWPANQALVAVIVPSASRQHYFGLSFTLLNAGIGLGGVLAGLLVSTADPGSFTWVYLADAASFLGPMVILLGPLRHIDRQAREAAHRAHDAETVERAGGSYREVLGDRVFRVVLLGGFLASFVGYSQMEAGWTAFARTIADASTRVIGLAFAANTMTIVALQLVVLRVIEGRRRTRVLSVLAGLWAGAWLLMSAAGLAPGSTASAVLLVASLAVFGLGETLLSPIGPALTNDLAPPRLRGRYNAASSLAFQVAAIIAPASAGVLLGARLPAGYLAMLLGGCAALVAVLRRLERRIPPAANGVRTPADDELAAMAAGQPVIAPEPVTELG